MPEPDLIRIQKYLSQAGICSRRKAEQFIEQGYVLLNGDVVTEQGLKINPDTDIISLSEDAKKELSAFEYICFNKPKGIVTHSPQEGERCIHDVLPDTFKHLAPIGRLDKDSCGLILLTNDGLFARRCLQGGKPHKRLYEIKLSKPITDSDIELLEDGIMLQNEKTKPCTIKRLNPYKYQIELIEGKNRQIRRMIQRVGSMVVFLKRIKFGKISLGDLKESHYRVIQPGDVF